VGLRPGEIARRAAAQLAGGGKLVLSGKSDTELVDELYLASFSRRPTPDESGRGVKYLSGGPKAARAQDLLWALLNSKAFLYVY